MSPAVEIQLTDAVVGQHIEEGYLGPIVSPVDLGGQGGGVADSGSGDDIVGASANFIYVPYQYVPGTFLSDTSTWDNTNLAALGVAPGTYEWSWGPGVNQNVTLLVLAPPATPLPAALPLFASGLGGRLACTAQETESTGYRRLTKALKSNFGETAAWWSFYLERVPECRSA